MKIGKKLTIFNIFINIIAMSILCIIISNIVSDYIEKDIKDDLSEENTILIKTLYYDKFLYKKNYLLPDSNYKKDLSANIEYYNKIAKESITSVVFDVSDSPKLIGIAPKKIKKELTKSELNSMLNQDLEDAYTITISNKSYLAYNGYVEFEKEGIYYKLLVTTLLPNKLAQDIKTQIIRVLVTSIVAISVVLIIVTNYSKQMITKPIKILVKITEKIAKKDFDEKVDLSTGDEFEILANAINEMSDSLKKQDIQQKKFYQNISHELKTPLTVISGYAQGIKTNIFEDSNKALDTIVDECNNLKKQLENIIYLSKLDTVNEFYNFKECSLNELLSDALQKVDSIIIINEVDIIYEPSDDVIINVDAEKISRLLINILSNGLKYTKDTIYINTEKLDEVVRIEISDNGKGFSKNLLKNPFSGTIIGEKDGSGIGLSIIKKIVDGHKGSITLDNKKEGGVT